MKRFFLFALVATMFAACATDQTQDVAVGIEAPETLTVSFDEESRIELKNGKTVWSAGDLLSVFYRSNANEKWQFQGQTGDRSGAIKRVAKGNEATHELSNIVIVYPYNANYYINPRTYNVQATLPATQTYLADSYGLDGSVMISSSEYKNFSLKNVCGWLKVQLTGNGEAVRYITLKGNNGEQVAGEIYINSENASCELAAESGIIGDDMQVGGSMFEEGTVLTKVTLDCGNGVTLGSKAKAFYIALPPQEFSKGLTIDIEAIDGSKMTKSTSNEITIERNAILPMTAFAYEGTIPEVFEITYATNDGNPLDPYTTEGFGANFVENVYDAATGKGALKFESKITAIPVSAFAACNNLTEINLPIGITSIGASVFNSCTNLAIVNIPQSVKTIGDKAFYNCRAVTEITIPSSVTSIGISSFEGCGGKATINCQIESAYATNNGKFGKAKFTEVIIDDSVTSIGDYAFSYCGSLTSVTIPDSVTSIGSYAFYGCSSLTSVTIPDSVTSIRSYTFYNCSSLVSITIPDSIISIGAWAFSGCGSLKDVYYTGTLSAWCKISFGETSSNPICHRAKFYIGNQEVTDITIPSDITEVKNCTFYGCTSLTSVTIHNRVTSIGKNAFGECTNLVSISIGNRVTSIGNRAFFGCANLTSITIPNNITNIASATFENCSSLTSINIPSSVTEIGDSVFENCSSLTSITIPDSVTSIGGSVFKSCSSLTSVTIPNSVTNITSSTFYGCSSLASITIPNGVTSIGGDAFRTCSSLTSVTIPNSVISIGDGVFWGCDSLKEVYCKPTIPPILGDKNAFYGNDSGRKIYVPAESVEEYKSANRWSSLASAIEPYDF